MSATREKKKSKTKNIKQERHLKCPKLTIQKEKAPENAALTKGHDTKRKATIQSLHACMQLTLMKNNNNRKTVHGPCICPLAAYN